MSTTEPLNSVILRGRIAAPPELRELTSGAVLQFDLSVADPDGRRVSVPVSWPQPSDARAQELQLDLQVVVVGWARRRFFRTGGATQSRTEVVATEVIPVRRRRAAASAVQRAVEAVLAC